jgi:hypothetical protein
MHTRIIGLALAATLTAPAVRAEDPAPAVSQPPAAAPAAAPAAEASEREKEPATKGEVKALLEEIRRLKLELGLRDVEYQSYGGMGPAASKVYFAPKGLSLGGYGEAYYQNTLDRHTAAGALVPDKSDLYRVVLYTGYRFSPRIVFNSEVEFEHQNQVHVEFAYLDFLLHDALRLRIGNVLVPLGFVNEMHEPPFFNGVLRPDLETNLLPSTWNENGLGLHGDLGGGLRYKAYVLTGLNATNKALRGESWLRRARTAGSESPSETIAGVASLAYEVGPAALGAGVYHGRAGQGARDAEGYIDAEVTLAEAHAQVSMRGLQVRAMAVQGWLGDSARISAFQGGTPPVVLGKRTRGAYAEVAYDLLGLLAPDAGQSLSPFVRFEDIDLHHSVAGGLERDPAHDYTVLTAGLGYEPLPTVVLKADYQVKDSAAAARDRTEQVNVGVGFVF